MGLVYYLENNKNIFKNFDLVTDADKLIEITKAYTACLFADVKTTIENPPQRKSGYMSNEAFYMFPEIRKNYKIQEKQKLDHLYGTVESFC